MREHVAVAVEDVVDDLKEQPELVAEGAPGPVLGGIGWFGFLLCVLALIVLALATLGRTVFRRTSTA